MITAKVFEKICPLEYHRRFLERQTRPDGRGVLAFRPIEVSDGGVATADASVVVRIGGTVCLAGCQAQAMSPSADGDGISGKIVPSLTVFGGPFGRQTAGSTNSLVPCFEAILQQVLDTRYDTTKLCIEKDGAVWCIYADLYILEDDGAVLDATVVALCHVLHRLRLPKDVSLTEEGEVVVTSLSDMFAPFAFEGNAIQSSWVPSTFAWLTEANILVADPTLRETEVSQGALLTVTVDKTTGNVVDVFKWGRGTASAETLNECIRLAIRRAAEADV